MPSHARPPVSLLEKLAAGVIAIKAASRALLNSFTDASIYKPHNWPFKRIFVVKLIRELGPLQEAPYGQSLSPTTGDAVRVACKQQKWPLQSHLLSPRASYADATLHEINIESSSSPPSRRRALLFFHGGGYRAAMARAGHMLASHSYAKTLEASHLFVLEYSLSPGQTYPTQLAQAVSSLAKLLVDFDFKPEEIVLAGDSAGGNLVFALLAHLIRPHSECSVIPQMQGKQLKAALCISPWVTMKYNSASCQENEEIDMLTKERMELFTRSFKPSEGHVWADMLAGDMSFWSQIPLKHILLTAGALEIFREDVIAMDSRLDGARENGTSVKLVVAQGEVHDQTVLDFALGTEHSQTTVAIYQWCLDIAKSS